MTVGAMLLVVACIALYFWLFRQGVFWGFLGLNVTKHVTIAYLCQIIGVDRRDARTASPSVPKTTPKVPSPDPPSHLYFSPASGLLRSRSRSKTHAPGTAPRRHAAPSRQPVYPSHAHAVNLERYQTQLPGPGSEPGDDARCRPGAAG